MCCNEMFLCSQTNNNKWKTKNFGPKPRTEFPRKIKDVVQKKCEILKTQCLEVEPVFGKTDREIADSNDDDFDLESEYIS